MTADTPSDEKRLAEIRAEITAAAYGERSGVWSDAAVLCLLRLLDARDARIAELERMNLARAAPEGAA